MSQTEFETFASFAFWLQEDMAPVCWHVLSWQGVRKAIGYLSIWRPWSLRQQPTSCLEGCYLCRAHQPTDSDGQTWLRQIGDAEKDCQVTEATSSFTHLHRVWGFFFFLSLLFLFQNLHHIICVSENMFASSSHSGDHPTCEQRVGFSGHLVDGPPPPQLH